MRASRLPLLLALCLLTPACATLTNATSGAQAASDGIIAQVCQTFPAISWSSKDTDETVKQIQAHNRAHDNLCGAD